MNPGSGREAPLSEGEGTRVVENQESEIDSNLTSLVELASGEIGVHRLNVILDRADVLCDVEGNLVLVDTGEPVLDLGNVALDVLAVVGILRPVLVEANNLVDRGKDAIDGDAGRKSRPNVNDLLLNGAEITQALLDFVKVVIHDETHEDTSEEVCDLGDGRRIEYSCVVREVILHISL